MRTGIRYKALPFTFIAVAAIVYAVLLHNGTVTSGRVQNAADVPERQVKHLSRGDQ